MPLSLKQVNMVCKIGKPNECKYLLEDELVNGQYQCGKLSSQKKMLDEVAEKEKTGFKKKPICDNCQGYPILRHKIVGFDQKTP